MKTYDIEVDCINCANKMEEELNKTIGIKKAIVNFMTLKVNIDFDENIDEKEVLKTALKNCKKVEEDIEIFF